MSRNERRRRIQFHRFLMEHVAWCHTCWKFGLFRPCALARPAPGLRDTKY